MTLHGVLFHSGFDMNMLGELASGSIRCVDSAYTVDGR